MSGERLTNGCRAVEFVKMEGLGNDFVVVLDPSLQAARMPELARRLCDRHLGVGADGLVLVHPDAAGARLLIYNADGSAARNCGNALRCVAQLLWAGYRQLGAAEGLPELVLRVEGGSEAVATPRRVGGELWPVVRLDPPELAAKAIPMELPPDMHEPVLDQELRLGAETLRVTCLSVGNPHCVIFLDDLDGHHLTRLGPRLETAAPFPDRTNVELVHVRTRAHLEVLVWERGAGPTLACGTGACAAAVAARLLGKTEPTVTVDLPGGSLEVTWLGEGLPIFLAGPARRVFEGRFPLSV
jgi:diaminopimelate epimerase